LAGFCLAGFLALPAVAAEKIGMPDLGQEEQTCLPTSTANLIVWFGLHGYPKLIVKGDSADDGYIHTVHALMTATNATYQLGTRTDAITRGIEKYIQSAGYSGDVEYRGLDWSQTRFPSAGGGETKLEFKQPVAFTENWLLENDSPDKGFILLLAYCKFDSATDSYTDAIQAGHAVTLVNAEKGMLLIHDPSHFPGESGRKILTPELLTGGTFQLPGYSAPVSGLLQLSGTLMDKPPDSGIILTGAVCVTMHPDKDKASVAKNSASSPAGMIAGDHAAGTTPATPSHSTSSSWATWLFDFFFK
jgi:hypothetical protein